MKNLSYVEMLENEIVRLADEVDALTCQMGGPATEYNEGMKFILKAREATQPVISDVCHYSPESSGAESGGGWFKTECKTMIHNALNPKANGNCIVCGKHIIIVNSDDRR